jgi:hypothetical protein
VLSQHQVVAGVHPDECLPVCLDVGTDNPALLADPKYIGLRRKRVRGAHYEALVTELFAALRQWQPHTLVQFEDFGNLNAFWLLEKFRHSHCAFNDDIQGTACIVLAGLLAALRLTGGVLREHPANAKKVANRNGRVWRGGREWSLNDRQIPNPNVVRVALRYEVPSCRGKPAGIAYGPVSDPPPEIPLVTIRNFVFDVTRLVLAALCRAAGGVAPHRWRAA